MGVIASNRMSEPLVQLDEDETDAVREIVVAEGLL